MPRYALYALLIFTPLARASVQDWAVTVIHMVTLIALTAFLLERCLSRDWEWIRTPLDMPIICLLAVCLLSSIFSLYKAASLWAFILLVNYVLIYYLVIQAIRTRAQFMHLVHLIIGIAAFLAIFGLAKSSGTNPSRLVRGVTVGALSGITAMLIHSLGDFNLQIPADALLFTVLVALVASPPPIDHQPGVQGNRA